MNDHVPLTAASNICELSTIGSIYVLTVIIFRSLARAHHAEYERRMASLDVAGSGGLVATQAWMTIYMPPWVGYPLLWHLVPPGRMVLAGGLLHLVVAFLLGQASCHSGSPFLAICVSPLTLVLAWFVFKHPHGIGLREAYRDWVLYSACCRIVATLQAIGVLTPARGQCDVTRLGRRF